MTSAADPDGATPGAGSAFDARIVRHSEGLVGRFNRAGVLAPVDVHTARVLGRLTREADESVLLAAALAVRAPRHGHVHADLVQLRETILADERVDVDLDALPWPEPTSWLAAVAASPLVDPSTGDRPLRLVGSRLYLDRYWRYEQHVASELRRRAALPARPVDADAVAVHLQRLFPDRPDVERPDLQRLAAALAVSRRLGVLAGGPGTGKTRTIARVLALLALERGAAGPPQVALAAPTGKAADRVAESIRHALDELRPVLPGDVISWLERLQAQTLHRLLGRRSGSDTRFRHGRDDPVPADVVIVDESSMVSLALMSRLLDAVSDRTQVILIGDPDQLAAVEAGSVLGDIVGPAREQLTIRADASAALHALTGQPPGSSPPEDGPPIGDAIVVLQRARRYAEDSAIAALARAIRQGDARAVLDLLAAGRDGLRWFEDGDASREDIDLDPVRAAVVTANAPVVDAARRGDAAAALAALAELRVLCAHRRGPHGVETWVPRMQRWLEAALPRFSAAGRWYVGQPILITRNDYQLDVRNGDVGVVVSPGDGATAVAFPGRGAPRLLAPARLEWWETVHAMTVHKSQGSQFGEVVVVLPGAESRILTRELLYTAVTRAERGVTVVGTEAAVRAAVTRPIQRASGLRAALWGTASVSG